MTASFKAQQEQISSIPDAEMAARRDLAALCRLFHYFGWDELIFAHLSLRDPTNPNHFLINPYGLLYSEVCASNLVKVNGDGNIVSHSVYPFNPAAFTTHGAIHAASPGVHCVLHAHTTAGMAVASTENGLSMSNIYAAQLHGRLAYHDFEGLTLDPSEGDRLIADVSGKTAVIMRNHGLFALGRSVVDAFNTMWLLNRACEVQIEAQSMGRVIEIPHAIQERCARDSFHFNPDYGAGREVFVALLRELERVDPSYKY